MKKRSYTAPKLHVFGTVAEITGVTNDSNRNDFSTFPGVPNGMGSLDLCLTEHGSGVCVDTPGM